MRSSIKNPNSQKKPKDSENRIKKEKKPLVFESDDVV